MQKNIDGLQVITHGNKSNQSIIFIHGFPFDHTLWDDVIADFSDAYYCISYDIRGFGKSDVQTGQFTMERYVDDLGHIISALGVEQPILCGFSMGGYIALRANEKLETKFAALILANTATGSDSDEAKLKRAAAISSIDENGVEPFLDQFFSAAFSEGFVHQASDTLKKLKNRILRFSPVGIKGGLLAMVSRTDTTQSLNSIESPVLLITGENDKIISPDTMKNMAKKIKNHTFVSLHNSGHMSMYENPDAFKSAMLRFLTSIE